MKKDVIISIKGAQRPEDGESGAIELVTDGEYSFDNGNVRFSYMESELTGLNGTRTSFDIDHGTVTLTRCGTVNSSMVFQVGKKHYFAYETPFGAVTMGVDTHSIKNRLGETGGDLEIRYVIDLESAGISRNVFKINIKEAQRTGVNG
jgi:uncharacterized beta-barrel protein YwiB (DUF1934 family)